MRTERYETIAPIAHEWDELADRAGAAPWVRPGWIDAWWRAFGKGRLEIVALRRGDSLVGVGAASRRHGDLLSPTNWHTPEFGLLAEDDDAVPALAAALWSSSPRSVHLSFLSPTRSGVPECRAAARAAGYQLLERVVLRSPYVRIEGEWKDYAAHLSRHMLNEIGRCRRRLESNGAVVFELLDGSENLEQLLKEGFTVERSGWKGKHRTGIADRPDIRQFYTDIASWAASRGILRLGFLRLEGKPIAFEFNIQDRGVCYALKGGYDETYRGFGPGIMLTHEMLKYAFSERLSSYEFLGSDEPFKMAWTSLCRDRLLFQAFAPSPLGFFEYAGFAYGRPLIKRALGSLPHQAPRASACI